MKPTQYKITLTPDQVLSVQGNSGPDKLTWPKLAAKIGVSYHVLKNNLRLLDNVPEPKKRGNPRKVKQIEQGGHFFSWRAFVQKDFIFKNDRL